VEYVVGQQLEAELINGRILEGQIIGIYNDGEILCIKRDIGILRFRTDQIKSAYVN